MPPVQPLLAQPEIDSASTSSDAGPTEQASPDGGDKEGLERIVALHMIREDYDGVGLSYPSKLFVDSVRREIYVIDSGNSRVLVFTHDFYPLLSIGKSDGVEAPVGLAVDPQGYLFIAQSPGGKHPRPRISVFDPCLKWKKDIFFSGFEGADDFRPTNIAINKEAVLYVAGSSSAGVVVLNKDGTFSHLLSPKDRLGKKPEQKASICDVEIDEAGRIYLSSEDMGRVYVYDNRENFLFKFGKKGGSSGRLSRPRGIGIDSRNKRIYVIDYMRHTANAYSAEGSYLFEFGGRGWGKGWFQFPSDISVDTSGNVLVADTFNNRVQVLAVRPPVTVAKIEKVAEEAPRVVATQEPAQKKPSRYYVLSADMNLREKGSTKSKIIQSMRKGEEFKIIDEHKHDDLTSWYLITTRSGLTGWLCGIYRGKVMFIEKVEEDLSEALVTEESGEKEVAKYYVLTADMNLREQGSTKSKIIQSMRKGEEFEIIDEHKHDDLTSWYFITTKSGLTGWLCGIYRGRVMFTEKERNPN
jgi:uncharacterized protein YgiM (DUF1202 family)